MFVLRVVVLRPGTAARVAPGLRLRADRPVRDRSRASSAAERDHAARASSSGFVFSFFTEPGWVASLIGILVGGGVLYLIAIAYYRVRHEEGLGMGDPKMLAMIGAFLGWKLTLRDADDRRR